MVPLTPLLPCLLGLVAPVPLAQGPEPLRVCASTPDLASLARTIGGDAVAVTCFVKGVEDPHFLEARPSFIKALAGADLWIEVGLELEHAWAPLLLQQCRNGKVLPGAPGFVDASSAITPLGVASGKVDRSRGDVHADGNPHYLLDPLNGVRVAHKLSAALSALRPEAKPAFAQRCADFEKRVGAALVGKRLADLYDWQKLAVLHEHGRLLAFLEAEKAGPLEGWLGALAPLRGTKVVVDHDLWPYFARRFGLEIVATLEPLPGVPPTTKHLQSVIARVRSEGAKAVLASPYYDPRHAEVVAKETGIRVVAMAHQAGARPGADDYLATVDRNVRALLDALRTPN